MVARLINDGDIFFLSHGSTCWHIAKAIKEKNNITVITNNLLVISELSTLKNINLISTGGNVSASNNSPGLFGNFAIDTIEKVFTHKAFVSVDAISLDHGYMVSKRESFEVLKAAKKYTADLYVVSDYSKFFGLSMLKIWDMDEGAKGHFGRKHTR